MDRYVAPLRAGRVVVFSRRRNLLLPLEYMCYSSKRVVLVERRYFSTTPREGMYVLLRNKRYREMTPKHVLRPVLTFPKYETLY